jgi:hypothetical protein
MNPGRTVLAQILAGLSNEEFSRCAKQYPMSRDTPALSAYDHFAVMVFAQLTYRESLRDIETCLQARRRVLYHSGIRGRITRTNLAYANEHRAPELFGAVAAVLMRRAARLYADTPTELGLEGELFAVDASLIKLSLALFPWARWQGSQAAVKLNMMLRVTTALPSFCTVVPGDCHDVNFMDDLPVEAGDYFVFDRGYLDFGRLHRIDYTHAWFVVRSKCNIRFGVCESRPVDKATGLRCDQTIRLKSKQARRDYPEKLRRIRYYDAESNLSLVFLTNNFALPALVIAAIYRRRWAIELFFRWIKQHLRLRGFFATNPNGVAVQIWTAICAYLLVAIAKREMALPGSLHQILQIVSLSTLEKVPLPELFTKDNIKDLDVDIPIQLEINGF